MKYLLLLSLLLLSQLASAFHIKHEGAKVDVDTNKVTAVFGDFNDALANSYEQSLADTATIPGPRIVLINSPGGYVDAGETIIELMEREKSRGVRQICVVMGAAASMAFNLLTHCDVRLATANSHLVAHKIYLASIPSHIRLTAKNLQAIADDLNRTDEPFRRANAKAMGLTLREYDRIADADTVWVPKQLLRMRYLHGIYKAI